MGFVQPAKKPLAHNWTDVKKAVLTDKEVSLVDTEKGRRIRQIGVELVWAISRIKNTGNIDGEAEKLELWAKELEAILISIGVSEAKLHTEGFLPENLRGEMRGSEREPTNIDGEALLDDLTNNRIGLDVLHRPQLIALCWRLNYTEVDTRGKSVKLLREMVTKKMAVNNDLPKQPLPQKTGINSLTSPPVNGAHKLTSFRIPRHLT